MLVLLTLAMFFRFFTARAKDDKHVELGEDATTKSDNPITIPGIRAFKSAA